MRYGMTIPLTGVPLHAQRDYVRMLEDVGYTDLWTAETDGADGLSPLILASQWTTEARLGVAILPVYTRGPALLAQSIAAVCSAAPGRVVIGLGSSSDVIVQRWNAMGFEAPYQRVRDTVTFLREALAGEKVSHAYETFTVRGFRLALPPEQPPALLIAALREGMLRLAGRIGDGAILNWLAPEDVPTVAALVREQNPEREIVARIFVVATDDAELARSIGRRAIAAYLNVPVYAAFHDWLGRGARLQGMRAAWAAGDRAKALTEIGDDLVDELIVHGSPERCRERVQAYVDNGVTTPVLALLPHGGDPVEAARQLAPA
ncbi:MAG: hypothetical protein QOE99_3370 [Actinomycetota bacterium]|nr:hypothetical protein [Actinomycetota bacterium]